MHYLKTLKYFETEGVVYSLCSRGRVSYQNQCICDTDKDRDGIHE